MQWKQQHSGGESVALVLLWCFQGGELLIYHHAFGDAQYRASAPVPSDLTLDGEE